MQEMIFSLLILGVFSGIIPAILVLILVRILIGAFKAMKKSTQVLVEKEPPKKFVKRNIREELWDEAELDSVSQFSLEEEEE